MKVLQALLISLGFMLCGGAVYPQATTWNFDPAHSKIQFISTHMGISEVSGNFSEYSGTISTEGKDFSNAKISVIIKANSIDTDNEKRDEHLKAEDFLDVEKYPEIKFTGIALKKMSDKKYKLTGNLTIRDVTRTEEFNVEHKGIVSMKGKKRAGFKVTGTINRFDYNIDWNKSFSKGLVIGKKIDIVCNIELISGK